MRREISFRLMEIVDALPLKDGIRVLEIGCGTGVAAREIAGRIANGYILGIDRSPNAIRQAIASSKAEIEEGRLEFRQVAIEEFEVGSNEARFDLAFAVRVGALDGRHPELEMAALTQIVRSLTKEGKLFIDGGSPLKEIILDEFRQEAGI